jgi:hypothetical protein
VVVFFKLFAKTEKTQWTVSWLVKRLVARPVVSHARRNNAEQRQVGTGAECFLFPLEGLSTSAGAGPIYISPVV